MRRNLLLLVFAVLACVVFIDRRHRDAEARRVASIDQLGGFIDHGGRFIVLGGPAITDETIKRLRSFPELEYLALPRTALTAEGVAVLAPLPRLRALDFLQSPVDKDLCRRFASLPRLSELKLMQTGINDGCLEVLGRLADLEVLDLCNCPISDDGLRHLRSLRRLRVLGLRATAVGDGCVVHLGKLPGLERVDLQLTRVTERGLADLQAAAPVCQISY